MSTLSFLRRKVFIPLNTLKDRSPRLRYLKYLRQSQYEDFDVLKRKQFQRLRKIIAHAYEHSSFYKKKFDEAGVLPNQIKSEDDLKKIPLLTKDDVQENIDSIISVSAKREELIPFKTGGSTGKSVTTFKDFNTMELEIASALRAFEWTGWKLGEPWGRVWGNPPQSRAIKSKLRNLFLDPQIYLDTMKLSHKTMKEFVEKWNRIKPTILHGHSHSLYLFSLFCAENNVRGVNPKGIISTSMTLLPREREVIESVFSCKVTDLYGCEEVGLIASECEVHSGLHINVDNIFVEFLSPSGEDVRPGSDGQIIITSLRNKAMPLIRYKVDDIGVPSDKRCPCGRSLPMMERVTGRVADFLVKKDGGLVAGISLVERTLTAIPGIKQMQIIQEDIDNIRVNLARSREYNSNTKDAIITELKNSIGQDVKVSVIFVENIPKDPSGKYRFSISKVENPFTR